MPTRTNVRAPSSASSEITIAALGPPMPVLWIVSGRPSAIASPVYPQSPRLWLNIFGREQLRLGERERSSRVAGEEHPLGQWRRRVDMDRLGHGRQIRLPDGVSGSLVSDY